MRGEPRISLEIAGRVIRNSIACDSAKLCCLATLGSPLKRSSYRGGVESVEVFARYGYRAASDAPTERGW